MSKKYCEICNCKAGYTYIDENLQEHHICHWCNDMYELCVVCGTFDKKKNMNRNNLCKFCEEHTESKSGLFENDETRSRSMLFDFGFKTYI